MENKCICSQVSTEELSDKKMVMEICDIMVDDNYETKDIINHIKSVRMFKKSKGII
jgi:hypothetical protein